MILVYTFPVIVLSVIRYNSYFSCIFGLLFILVDGIHLPVIVSFPHFHQAASQYKDAILGLETDTEQYSTVFYLEPVST